MRNESVCVFSHHVSLQVSSCLRRGSASVKCVNVTQLEQWGRCVLPTQGSVCVLTHH